MLRLLPLRTATAFAAAAIGTVASAGLDLAARPARTTARILPGSKRSSGGDGRAWIAVPGLSGPDGAERGRAVVDALHGQPAVVSVRLNRPLSRVVVEFDEDAISQDELCSVVADAEKRCTAAIGQTPSSAGTLPGDGLFLAARGAMVAVNAAGLGIAVLGRVLRLPAAPVAVDAVAAIANYQPWLRGVLTDRIGAGAADTVLSLTATAAHVFTLSPAKVSVDLLIHALQAAECRSEARAWARYEPELARYADQPDVHPPSRPSPPPAGPIDRHGQRMAVLQLVGTGLIGALTRDITMASTAAMVAAPKAMRTSCESFAATLGQGLAEQHPVLPLRPESLRRLGTVDTVLIDPRVLCGDELRVVRIRGVRANDLPTAWSRAQDLLGQPGLAPGWYPVPGAPAGESARTGAGQALILPAHHPLASAVVTRARGSGAELVSVDADILGELRAAFDDVRPIDDKSIDDALADTLADLQQAGRTVAVLSSAGAQALSSADVGLGVMTNAGSTPPWNADLILFDLAGAWQVLHALPAARQAAQRGIAISTAASAMGALLMVPGVRGSRGPGPVTIGAAAGLLSGYLLARQTIRTPVPRPAPAYDWHAMSVQQVRAVLAHPATPHPPRAGVMPESPARFRNSPKRCAPSSPVTR